MHLSIPYSKRLAILSGLYHSIRLLTGSIHAFFLIQCGISLKELALFQIVFNGTSLIVSYPIGVITDKYGSKLLMIIACILLSLYYLICSYYTNNLSLMIFAHILQGLSLSLIIAMPSWIIESTTEEERKEKNYLNHLGHLDNEIQAIGGVIAGTY